jgi:flagellar hook-associated protein 2
MNIGNNIISSLGIGSGIQSGSMVEQLTALERAPAQERIDTDRGKFSSQVSDIGFLKNAMSLLQDSADVLADSATFASKTASYNDSKILVPELLDENAVTGSYNVIVDQLASAHSLSVSDANAFTSPTAIVGSGTLKFSFGEWVDADTFLENTELSSKTLTIDGTNNTLNGIKDAINKADMGVQASIVDDGANGHKLVLTSPSGKTQQMRIEVTEAGGSPTNTDNDGLSRLAFVEGGANRQLSQLKGGQDALFRVNNLAVVRSDNKVDDVIDGFTFTLSKKSADDADSFNIDINEDKTVAEQAVRDFVEGYNAFLEAIQPLVGFTEGEDGEEGSYGSLYRDPTVRTLLSSLREQIVNQAGNTTGNFTALTNLGVRTELDGSLSINDKDFRAAFDNNFADVRALFVADTQSSSDKVLVNNFTQYATQGVYEIAITTEPSQGSLTGNAVANNPLAALTTPVSGYWTGAANDPNLLANLADVVTPPAATDYDFSLIVDGVATNAVSITPGTYADYNALAIEIQNNINADTNLLGVSKTVTVTYNGTGFVITSDSTGDNSSVTGLTNIGGVASELGLSSGSVTAGAQGTGDYSLSIRVDGTDSGTINVAYGSYADNTALAIYLEQQINNDSALKEAGKSVTVSWDTDHFVITSESFGSSSAVFVTDIGAEAVDLGLSAGTSNSGEDVAGTVNGVQGFGSGNVFLPALNTPAYGLSFLIAEGATTSQVTFSRGFGAGLSSLLENYLSNNGILAEKEQNINRQLDRLEDKQDTLDRRIEAYEARLMAQFIAMERIINSLNSSGSFLDGLADRLPNTARNG